MRTILFTLFFVSLLSPLYAQLNRNSEIEEDIIDPAIVLPESLQNDVDSLLSSWYMRKYIRLDSSCISHNNNIDYPDSIYIKRLSSLPTIMEMPYNSVVRSYIELYTQRRRNLVSSMMGLGAFYFPIFEEELDRQGLPLELKYLPIIESALQPEATSRMGAAGLWQFMLGTGKFIGLEINSLIDQRRDPIISTQMAVKYLKQLHNIYQDWSLAIAAYNCGPGNVNKAIRRAGGQVDYWKIYNFLPKETRGYVPAFIAANYVMHFYNEHNICPAIADIPMVTDTIMVSNPLHLKQLSEMLEIPMEQLRSLNPQYRRDLIPASNEKPRSLRLPSTNLYTFLDIQDTIFNHKANELLARRSTVEPGGSTKGYTAQKVTYHRVNTGETLSRIASKYGVSVQTLKKWNHLKSNQIAKGKNLKIYRNMPAMKQPEPQQEYLAKAKTKEQQLDTTNSQWHEVASGESLSVIAQRYGVTAIQIKTWNNLEKNTIQRGQKLRVKEKPAEQPILIATIVTDSVDPNRLAPIKQNPAKPIIPSFDYHKVQRGENLSAIAKRYHGVTAGDIKELNQLPNNNLRVGQVLKIPRG